ncbi:MAG: ABC transporter ATP-binding protein [Dethiobacter sp.]|jgi:simple sugar transport system ATP-binding protein|nr:ABC transporter ATP-binding protein [Dethiobacter sp.]
MNIVEMKNICKQFPGVQANDHIYLDIREGEIHALLGENGAGKSTLMNVLYGLYGPEKGEICFKGKKVDISCPNDAIKLGIGMVHQHFMLVPPFTVTENIVLGTEPSRGPLLDYKQAVSAVKKASHKYGLNVDPDALIRDISVGMQQRVEILKVLFRGAELLILDEPTAVLTPQEIEDLYRIMKNLRDNGHTIVIITHKLKEVKHISDRVTVLRNGKNIGTVQTGETDEKTLAKMMVGRDVVLRVEKPPCTKGNEVLKVTNLHAGNYRRLPALKGCSLDVCEGEIVGVAGVEGNGQTELIQVLTGLQSWSEGEIRFKGKKLEHTATPQKMLKSGLGHIPEDRQKRGLVLDFSVKENMIMGFEDSKELTKSIFIDYEKVNDFSRLLVKEFDIRTPSIETKAGKLSGGNQQKVIVARELARNPRLLIAAQPTRGLDVGAIEFVHNQLIYQRGIGRAILLVSYELEEIMALSDRIVVLYDGQIIQSFENEKVSMEELGFWMGGGSRKAI